MAGCQGLNEPVVVQYWQYLKGVLQGDLGVSYYSSTPVTKESAGGSRPRSSSPWRPSSSASIVGIFLGVVAAVKKNSVFDAGSMLVALVGVSIPIFWLGILMIMLFSGYLHLLPTGGRINVLLEPAKVTGFYMIDSLLEGNWAAFRDAFIHLICRRSPVECTPWPSSPA